MNLFRQKRFQCPCCGFYTLDSRGEYDICKVCFWEDDPSQSADELDDGGANHVSLVEARKNYLAIGVCKPDMVKYVRQPKPEEMR